MSSSRLSAVEKAEMLADGIADGRRNPPVEIVVGGGDMESFVGVCIVPADQGHGDDLSEDGAEYRRQQHLRGGHAPTSASPSLEGGRFR